MSARSSRLRPGHVKVRTRLHLKVQGGTGPGWCPAEADPAGVEIALETRGAVQRIGSPVGGQGMNTGIGDAVNLAFPAERAERNAAQIEATSRRFGRERRG